MRTPGRRQHPRTEEAQGVAPAHQPPQDVLNLPTNAAPRHPVHFLPDLVLESTSPKPHRASGQDAWTRTSHLARIQARIATPRAHRFTTLQDDEGTAHGSAGDRTFTLTTLV